MADSIDGTLKSWDQIANDYEGGSIIVGNGMSQNVWKRFRYGSLKQAASEMDRPRRLTDADIALFTEFGTDNFEVLLSALLSTSKVLRAVKSEHAGSLKSEIDCAYSRISASLADAVHFVHVLPKMIPRETLVAMWDSLDSFESVYSTNYDLLLYWAMMVWAEEKGSPSRFRDFFLRDGDDDQLLTFSSRKAEEHRQTQKRTDVLYLHGALHLVRLPSGVEAKLESCFPNTILDQYEDYLVNGTLPLLVSGGTAEEKKKIIRKSVYLDFCRTELFKDDNPLVIFGHALGESDAHIRKAIRSHRDRCIAVSVSRHDEMAIIERKAEVLGYFPGRKVEFFDSRTHPLGRPELMIEEIGELP